MERDSIFKSEIEFPRFMENFSALNYGIAKSFLITITIAIFHIRRLHELSAE